MTIPTETDSEKSAEGLSNVSSVEIAAGDGAELTIVEALRLIEPSALDYQREAALTAGGALMDDYENELLILSQIAAEHANARALVLAAIQDRLDAIDLEFKPRLEAQQSTINEKQSAIKLLCLQAEKTIAGVTFDCQFIKAGYSWNDKALEGYALARPEILDLRSPKPATTRFMPKRASKA